MDDVRDVEQVVDQMSEQRGLAVEHLPRATYRGGIGPALGENVSHVADGGERIAQLVRQDGQELVLASISFTQRPFGALAWSHVFDEREAAAHPAIHAIV